MVVYVVLDYIAFAATAAFLSMVAIDVVRSKICNG